MAKIEMLHAEIMYATSLSDIFGGEVTEALCDEMIEKLDPGNYIHDLDERQMAREALEKFKTLLRDEPCSTKRVEGIFLGAKGVKYQLLEHLGNTATYNLYRCEASSARPVILKVARTQEQNSLLDREAMILQIMRDRSVDMDSMTETGHLNFHYFFPEVLESFVCESQEGRRITMLGFPSAISDFKKQLTPLSSLIFREKIYVDPRTGAWIFGKMLKTVSFAHLLNITNGFMTIDNVLIERDKHGVIVFDWSKAELHASDAPEYLCRADIISAAKAAMHVMGATEQGQLPDNEQLADCRFEDLMMSFVQGRFCDAHQAYEKFYTLIWDIWPRKFHPFTSYARNSTQE